MRRDSSQPRCEHPHGKHENLQLRRDSSQPRCEHPHGKHENLQLRRDSSQPRCEHPHGKHEHLQLRRDSSQPRCEHPHGKHEHLQLRRDSSQPRCEHPHGKHENLQLRRDSSQPRCEHPHGKHEHLQLRRGSVHQTPGHPEQLDSKQGEDLKEGRFQRPASAPRLRQDAALPGAVAPLPVLDEQHHKDLATVWSSVWFRTHKGSGHGYSKELEAWTESKGVLQRLSCKMPVAKMQVKDPAKALQLVVASSGLLPAWLPESLEMEDEEDLNDALVQVTGTVFKHWCHARESEVRVDDLPDVMADLGIAVSEELLKPVLASNIYATLDWPDFSSVLKDYRRLERSLHRELFEERAHQGRLGAEEVEELLKSLGHPAALQSYGRSRKASFNFKAFEEFLRQLRLSEGFSQHDLRELHAFFEVEKTSQMARREPICRCGLQKVQQVMMLRGFLDQTPPHVDDPLARTSKSPLLSRPNASK